MKATSPDTLQARRMRSRAACSAFIWTIDKLIWMASPIWLYVRCIPIGKSPERTFYEHFPILNGNENTYRYCHSWVCMCVCVCMICNGNSIRWHFLNWWYVCTAELCLCMRCENPEPNFSHFSYLPRWVHNGSIPLLLLVSLFGISIACLWAGK